MTMRMKCNVVLMLVAFLVVTSVPLLASQMDNRIEKSAKKSYVFKTYLKGDGIKVKSDNGIVTLSGTVQETWHKTMAEETVRSLPGVTNVNNQITVTASPASASSDAWVSEKVRGTLLFHRSVSYVNTDVSVTDGRVTLRGKASSEAQKQLTTEYANDVSGVKTVDNQMTVTNAPEKSDRTKGEKIDDASITTQVKMSLEYHHGSDGFDTKVSTHKGVVTLAGTAKNQAEIDLATKRVNDVYGVKSVDNQMTVEKLQSSLN
jgi:hyperosmotically inducible periplasmic protein